MKTLRISFHLLFVVMGVGGAFWLTGGSRTELPGEPISVSALLDEYPDGFPGVEPDRPAVFPEDHGPHPNQPMESWAFNAFLATKEGRQFGLQLGIFRVRLVPGNPQRESAWSTTEIYRGQRNAERNCQGSVYKRTWVYGADRLRQRFRLILMQVYP